MRPLAAVPRALAPLALLAVAIGLALPSSALAARSDLLLALLVLTTALGIPYAELSRLRRQAGTVAALSVLPLLALGALAWLIGRPFSPLIRDGLLAVGLSSSEVAAVGMVALAGADATLALGVVASSLVAAALIGPLAIGPLSGTVVHVHTGGLLARFALVVIVPLAVGVALRSRQALAARLARVDSEREGLAALTVAVLVYAALSGARGAHHLGAALVASLAFLLGCGCLAELWRRARARRRDAIAGALAIGMRDFAVAAALATQAFGATAAAMPGVYGVVMLLAGALAAGRLSR